MTTTFTRVFFICAIACGTNAPPAAQDAPSAQSACARVGIELCTKVYACWTAQEIAQQGYGPDMASCVATENASCASQEPGYCKGKTELSEAAAGSCADSLHADTCTDFNTATGGPCKTMCSP